MVNKPLEVTITVGTSFSIGGAFTEPERYKPVGGRTVLCEGHGLEFMLDCFARHNIKASFFIETAQAAYFGDDPMAGIAKRIMDAGHDVQLLIHPCWYYYDKSGEFSQNDSCAQRPYEELKSIFEKSIAAFERITGKKPDAIRCGNMQIDRQVYQVMSELDIPISSSIGLNMYVPEGKRFLLCSGRRKFEQVMEVPLFTYRYKDLMGGYATKTLQMASCSWREMRHLLKKARNEGIENIVFLTQPFDYIKKRDVQYEEITRNRVNQERLEKLCSFIAENPEHLTTRTFGEEVETWKKAEQKNNIKFRIPTRYRNMRKIENYLNDKFWNY